MRVTEETIQAEHDILERIDGLPIDLLALAVASNLWRASQSFRLNLERNVLRQYDLSWASFSTLFIVWIWGPIGMSAIAEHQAVSRPTVTSTVNHLEKRGYCLREFASYNDDRRTVQVSLTDNGRQLIEEVFPMFNQGETNFVSCLTEDDQTTLANLLRKLVRANEL
ncbi:MarR family transcriptional regulator [Chloroflexi bacterium TSY]|nr:MarR family transcriptional regulator [Chloroflexi bacterium TSY]